MEEKVPVCKYTGFTESREDWILKSSTRSGGELMGLQILAT